MRRKRSVVVKTWSAHIRAGNRTFQMNLRRTETRPRKAHECTVCDQTFLGPHLCYSISVKEMPEWSRRWHACPQTDCMEKLEATFSHLQELIPDSREFDTLEDWALWWESILDTADLWLPPKQRSWLIPSR